jgi:hypothetical protein
MTGAALLGVIAAGSVHAQAPVTERQAATYIRGGFRTDSAHAILSRDVKLGPELRRRLAVPHDADSRAIYEALVSLTDPEALNVRKATDDEVSRYVPRAGSELRQPLFALEFGDTTLLVQYDLRANNIPFVGQLAGPLDPAAPRPVVAPEPPKAVAIPPEPPKAAVIPPKPVAAPEPPKPVAAPEPPKPVATPEPPKPVAARKPKPVIVRPEPPKPPAAAASPPPAKPRAATVPAPRPRAEPLQPNGPCVVRPVMSNQDLVNCGATPP